MGEIQDMQDAVIMGAPQWPRCPRCGVELVERKDPRTGKTVRAGGRELLECPQCHDLVIAPSPQKQRGRYRKIRLLLIGSAAATGMITVVVNVLRIAGLDGLNFGLVMILVFIMGIGLCLHCLFEALAYAMTPQNKGNVRFESGFLAAFWAVVMGLCAWMAVKVGPEIWKSDLRGKAVLKGK